MTVTEPQTGKTFELVPERWFDIVAAWISILYSLATIACVAYCVLAFPEWKFSWLPGGPAFKLVVFAAGGGAIGAAVNNIRSFVQWHAERKAFGWRFVWKYISLPPLGATLAVIVYGIIRGGVAVFSGDLGKGDGQMATALFSAWTTGALAGYGSHKVFIWLDDRVNTMFKPAARDSQATVTVPDVSGKTEEESKQMLRNSGLELGDVLREQSSDAQMIDRVIKQTPAAGTEIDTGAKVDITLGMANAAPQAPPATKVRVPNVVGQTLDGAEKILQDQMLIRGDVQENQTNDPQMIGKVIAQAPAAETETDANGKVDITVGKG